MQNRTFSLFVIGILLLATAIFSTVIGQSTQAAQSLAPTQMFGTYYGGSTEECLFDACAVATDHAGNIYVAGTTRSDDFPLVNEYSDSFSGSSGEDIFLVKIAAGTHDVVFSTYVGKGKARDIAIDASNNIYLVGMTSDADFPTTSNAAQPVYGGGIDAYVVKLNAAGDSLLYGTFLGGSGRDEGYSLDVDDSGNIYLTGYTSSTDLPVLNPQQGAFGGNFDVFVARINAAGSLGYSTYHGGDRREEGWAIEVDSSGVAYVTGYTGSDDFPVTAGAAQPERRSNAGSDAFVMSYAPDGDLQFGTFYNVTSSTGGVDIAIDDNGNSYIVTTTQGVVKLNSSGSSVIYRTQLELDTNIEGEGGIDVDADGVVYVTGYEGGGIGREIAFAALAPNGFVIHTQTVGGSAIDNGQSVAIYEDGAGQKSAYIVGTTQSTDFPLADAIDSSLGGAQDLVVVGVSGLEELHTEFLFLPMTTR